MMEIRVIQLIKDYGPHRILDVDLFQVQKGKIVGLIGPNGAGKSTLVKIIGGLDTPTSGEVYYDGERIHPAIFQQMTVVFQKPYLLQRTVFENVEYPLRLRGVGKAERREKVDGILAEMGLDHLRHQRATTLSGGEAQKVALARALVFAPSLLILDEPTANIDPASIAQMEQTIVKANKTHGTTVILVTHNVQQARRICQDVAFVHNGQIIETGTPEELIFHAHHPVVRRFMEGELVFQGNGLMPRET